MRGGPRGTAQRHSAEAQRLPPCASIKVAAAALERGQSLLQAFGQTAGVLNTQCGGELPNAAISAGLEPPASTAWVVAAAVEEAEEAQVSLAALGIS